jgi:hypothetical protein
MPWRSHVGSATQWENAIMSEAQGPVWNSLEVTKLVVGAATPVTLAIVGALFSWQAGDRAQETAQYNQVVAKRIELWDDLGPKLNSIYCYLTYVGDWKELTPADVVKLKRESDRIFFTYRPFFSEEFVAAYEAFLDAAFKPYGGWRADARIRSTVAQRENASEGAFTGEDNAAAVHQAYYSMLRAAGKEFALEFDAPPYRPRGG